jgi:hypothetical protein
VKIFLDADSSPIAKSLFVSPKTLASNALGGEVDVLRLLKPVNRTFKLEFLIVISL